MDSREQQQQQPPSSYTQNPNYQYLNSSSANPGDGSFSGSGSGFGGPDGRKKRGRPRKYSPETTGGGGNNNTVLRLRSPNDESETGGPIVGVESGGSGKKGRGRPPGSGKRQLDALGAGNKGIVNKESGGGKKGRGRPPGSGKRQLDALGGQAGVGFTPHVILVNTGEDITSKIKAFSQQGPRTICILSANGATSNARICTSSLSESSVTYEGRYEIISLEGSFSLCESNGGRGRKGGMTVTLAGPDGRVFGGAVSGMLLAASPVQVIVGSFIEDGKKPKYVPSSSSPVPNMLTFGTPAATASPPSQGPSTDSSGENGGSGYDGGSGPYSNDNQQPLQSMPMYSHSGWGSGNMNMHPH